VTAYKNWQQIRSLERERVNIDEAMADAELCSIAKAKAGANGNSSHEPQYCHCVEYIINSKRAPFPVGHSCGYVAARNCCIDDAVREANKRVGDPGDDPSLWHRWVAAYNSAMNRLAYNAGLLR
jgi:hypothetical protein